MEKLRAIQKQWRPGRLQSAMGQLTLSPEPTALSGMLPLLTLRRRWHEEPKSITQLPPRAPSCSPGTGPPFFSALLQMLPTAPPQGSVSSPIPTPASRFLHQFSQMQGFLEMTAFKPLIPATELHSDLPRPQKDLQQCPEINIFG